MDQQSPPITPVQQAPQQPGEKYKNVERPFWKILLANFFGGIFWSIGVIIGFGLVFTVIAYFVRQIDFIPVVGEFMARVLESAQQNLPSGK